MRIKSIVTGSLAALALAACATVPAPQVRLADSQAAVRAAGEVGADKVPKAALHLQLANEGLETAQKMISKGQNERAEYTLQRAQADAELAIALAKLEPVRNKVLQTTEQLEQLKAKNVR